ncbi:biotin/lipoyl-binding protein [Pseudenhygromyxa sp. WMMC2535]|uniref:biotin/lipoyl-binding protein n=1 Tax=Pseudenhygromyxa sp. WMMC2535 TaxID=2712867 RepID=UPI001552EC62|nr:biotin/lipoyl-binding protein [Pseudenhygromyxa sp. WMMC2535]NVB39686.1 biotin/lipoyl-binding protein [Pseudenhygromyxa sp. WMMC2535]
MEFRTEAMYADEDALGPLSLAAPRAVEIRSPAVLRLPLLAAGVLGMAIAAASLMAGDELSRGRAVLRAPGSTHLRAAAGANVESIEVAPGEAVEAGQLLARLDAPERERALSQARARAREAMLASLRSPNDAALERELRAARAEQAAAAVELAAFELRAPRVGVVSSLRAEVGARVEGGDIVATLAPDAEDELAAPMELLAHFPGPASIEVGAVLKVDLAKGGRGREPALFRVVSVSRDWIDPEDPRALTELGRSAGLEGAPHSVVAVRARLERAPAGLELRDGMLGEAQLVLRERSALRRAAESLGFAPADQPDQPDQEGALR